MEQERNEKANALREVRKLNHILNTSGNCLVPNLPGKSETSALERVQYFLTILRDKFEIRTEQQLWDEINTHATMKKA